MDLLQEINKLLNQLEISVKSLRQTSKEYAKCYTEYRVALASELVKLKDSGTPATLCSDLARGNEKVAKAKFNEIASEGIYRANLEAINSIKIHIKALQEQYSKEYGANLND